MPGHAVASLEGHVELGGADPIEAVDVGAGWQRVRRESGGIDEAAERRCRSRSRCRRRRPCRPHPAGWRSRTWRSTAAAAGGGGAAPPNSSAPLSKPPRAGRTWSSKSSPGAATFVGGCHARRRLGGRSEVAGRRPRARGQVVVAEQVRRRFHRHERGVHERRVLTPRGERNGEVPDRDDGRIGRAVGPTGRVRVARRHPVG